MIFSKGSARSLKAVPISVKEFYDAAHRLQGSWVLKDGRKTIGLAISGGVDSMALALLCAKLKNDRTRSRDWRFQAFVVDHGARSGSYDEAKAVSKVLSQKGIKTRILQIEWPTNTSPSDSTKFETLARRYRFQALGKACRDYDIENLLLAHHEDDQAETVFMRLAGGHRGRGLMGIKSKAPIPECYGIYGVYQGRLIPNSEDDEVSEEWSHVGESPRKTTSSDYSVDSAGHFNHFRIRPNTLGSMQIETGGVILTRPLLQFSKERLLATCLAENMPWFEDHTNDDHSLTPRNTIRHILKNHRLPAALQKEALIALSRRLENINNDSFKTANDLLQRNQVYIGFEPRVGTLTCRFPHVSGTQDSQELQQSLTQQRNTARTMIQMLIETVTPEEHVTLSSLGTACETVFPELFPQEEKAKNFPSSFTIAGVKFERLDDESSPQVKLDEAFDAEQEHRSGDEMNHPTRHLKWLMSRQPHHRDASKQPLLEIAPLGASSNSPDWGFYDGRYWIHIANLTPNTLTIRPLRKEDLKSLQKALDPKTAKRLAHLLKTLAPGKVRFTLPVVSITLVSGKEDVVALPTLDICVPGIETLLEYEVRYKSVRRPFRSIAR